MIEELKNKIFKIISKHEDYGFMKITHTNDMISYKMIDYKYELLNLKGAQRFKMSTDEMMNAIKNKELILATEEELAKILLSGVKW